MNNELRGGVKLDNCGNLQYNVELVTKKSIGYIKSNFQ